MPPFSGPRQPGPSALQSRATTGPRPLLARVRLSPLHAASENRRPGSLQPGAPQQLGTSTGWAPPACKPPYTAR
ncbi:hypothetical protein NDU88_006796 [Pleurodeles waltl]|uniref:Uncharacterized protein n=1 Tax=Pleurodeles waltl TaxID=8319 RepID=A0AAV7X2P5_PLEWA|nr:hypothetical protein NDU88_006796 [Pleurodeles waltl]